MIGVAAAETAVTSGATQCGSAMAFWTAIDAGSGVLSRVGPQSPQQAATAEMAADACAVGQQSPHAAATGPAKSARPRRQAKTAFPKRLMRGNSVSQRAGGLVHSSGAGQRSPRVSFLYVLRCRSAADACPSFSARAAALKCASALSGSTLTACS